MAYSLPNSTTAQLSYGPVFDCPNAKVLQLTVANAAVYYQLGHGWPSVGDWEPEVFAVPGVHVIRRAGTIDAVRVRAAAATVAPRQPPQVSAVAT